MARVIKKMSGCGLYDRRFGKPTGTVSLQVQKGGCMCGKGNLFSNEQISQMNAYRREHKSPIRGFGKRRMKGRGLAPIGAYSA
jgi:hypothetical protein